MLNTFFLYSILGFILEISLGYQSGILYGPWTVVYGIGVVIIFQLYDFFSSHYSKIKSYLFVFFISFILLTILEWIGGILIEAIFGCIFWNYENVPFHIGKYVSLLISLLWSIGSILILIFLRPITDRFVKKIPKVVTWIFLILFLMDCFFTFYFKARIFPLNILLG
jgi:uncharacterized membrane protein